MDNIIQNVANIGVAVVLAVILVKAFLEYNKDLIKQNKELYAQFTEDAAKREEQYRQDAALQKNEYKRREEILVAESAKREEILKMESEKREQLLKSEAAKREAALINTIEGFSATMEKISKTMEDIKNSTERMQDKICGIENKLNMRGDLIGQGENNGNCAGQGPAREHCNDALHGISPAGDGGDA